VNGLELFGEETELALELTTDPPFSGRGFLLDIHCHQRFVPQIKER